MQLTVELIDINDNTPQFESLPQNITLSEGIPVSSIVLTVSATDDDTTSTVGYSITSNG